MAISQTRHYDFVFYGSSAEFRGCLRNREIVSLPFGTDEKKLIAPGVLAEKVFVFIPPVCHDDAVRLRLDIALRGCDVRHFSMRQDDLDGVTLSKATCALKPPWRR